MTDTTTGTPTAGWYPDPAGSGQERWWGGLDWTEHVRAPQPALPAAPMQLAIAAAPQAPETPSWMLPSAQPAYAPAAPVGIGTPDPFAGIGAPAQVAATPAPFGGIGAPAQGGGFVDPYAFGAASTPQWNAAPAYGTTSYATTPPSNPMAIVGLVASLIGFSLLGVIFSVIGLRKARGFDYAGERAVGRVPARWGLGLGIAGLVLTIAWAVFFGAAYFMILQGAQLPLDTNPVVQDPTAQTPTDGALTGDSDTARALEASITDSAAFLYDDTTVTSVTCPETVSDAGGNVVECTIALADGRAVTATTTYSADGAVTQYSE